MPPADRPYFGVKRDVAIGEGPGPLRLDLPVRRGVWVTGRVVDEETGGPFVETSGAIEFAEGTDASNPEDAKREPFPKT